MPEEEGTRLMTVLVKQELRARVKSNAAWRDITIQQAVEEALTAWCEKTEAELATAAGS